MNDYWRKNVRPGTTFGPYSRPYTLWQRTCDRFAIIGARIKCWMFGHKFHIHQKFSPWSRRVVCKCCDGDWAMNDNVRIMTPWTTAFSAFYEEQGHEIKPKKCDCRGFYVR